MKALFTFLTLTLASTAAAQAAEVNMSAATAAMRQPDALVIDVRSPDEFDSGAIDGALNIPHDVISQRIAGVSTDKNAPIVVYCRSGRRSDVASDILAGLGYRNVINGGAYADLKERLASRQ